MFCYTVRERTTLTLINELTDMPERYRKTFDDKFTFEWKSEIVMNDKNVTRFIVEWIHPDYLSIVGL